MFLTVIFVWIGLSLLATVLVLAAVIRSGQVDQGARDGTHEETPISPTPSSQPHAPQVLPPGHRVPDSSTMPEQEWGVPVRASNFSSGNPIDKI